MMSEIEILLLTIDLVQIPVCARSESITGTPLYFRASICSRTNAPGRKFVLRKQILLRPEQKERKKNRGALSPVVPVDGNLGVAFQLRVCTADEPKPSMAAAATFRSGLLLLPRQQQAPRRRR